jgi:hypothetical protein
MNEGCTGVGESPIDRPEDLHYQATTSFRKKRGCRNSLRNVDARRRHEESAQLRTDHAACCLSSYYAVINSAAIARIEST